MEFNRDQKGLIEDIVDNNDSSYTLLKAAEECNELATVLLQIVNKPNKVNLQELIDELGDVFIRLATVEDLYQIESSCQERVDNKMNKYKEYLGKYDNV